MLTSALASRTHLCILLPAYKHQMCFSQQCIAATAATDQHDAVQEELQHALAGKQAQCTTIADMEGSLAGLQQQLITKQEHNTTLENVSQTYSLRIAELEDSDAKLQQQQLDFLRQQTVDKVSHCARCQYGLYFDKVSHCARCQYDLYFDKVSHCARCHYGLYFDKVSHCARCHYGLYFVAICL